MTELIGLDSDHGIQVGQEYTITRHVVERNEFYINTVSGKERYMCRRQLELVS